MCKTDSWNDLILEGKKNQLTVSWYHYHSISDEDCACSDTYEPTTATTLGFRLTTFPATSLNHKPRARKKLSIHLRQLLWCMVCLDALKWTNTASMFMNADLILSLNRWQIHVRYAKSWSVARSAGGPQLPVAQKIYSAIPHARLASLTSERPQAINGQ